MIMVLSPKKVVPKPAAKAAPKQAAHDSADAKPSPARAGGPRQGVEH
jgi:hypothetical protein